MGKELSLSERAMKWTDEVLMPPLVKIGDEPHLLAVRNGLMASTGLVIVGSVLLLIASLGMGWMGGIEPVAFITPWSGKLLTLFNMTMGFMAAWIAFGIGYHYARIRRVDDLQGGILALCMFLIAAAPLEAGAIPTGNLGAAGIFTAIITGLVSVEVFWRMEQAGLVIKMPEGVPPAIATAFLSLFPAAVLVVIFGGIRVLVGFDIPAAILTLFKPLVIGAENVFAHAVSVSVRTLLWGVGIHGCSVEGSILNPFRELWTAENLEAFAAGVSPYDLPHIWTSTFDRLLLWTASTWPINIMCLRSKSPRLRSIGTVAAPASLFTIIEPLQFGLPIALNPMLFIPFVISPVIAGIFTWTISALKLVPRLFAVIPWCTPPPIIAFLGSGGSLTLTLVPFINTAIGYVIWWPFFKSYEKSVLAEEKVKAKAK